MKNFYFYNTSLGQDKPNLVVCFYSGRDICIETFFTEIVKEFESLIFAKHILFITPSFNKKSILERLLQSEIQDRLKDRINSLQELNFHTCFIDKFGKFDLSSFESTNVFFNNEEINEILELGLLDIIERRNLVINSHSNIHFVKPSGKHTNKFIDVRNILESSAEISFIATNLLKFLPKKISQIYIDTSGIYSLAFELSNLVRSFSEDDVISIDSFGSYARFREYKFRSTEDTLVLISASTSNELYKKLRHPGLLDQANFITLVMTQHNDSSQKVLIEFEKYQAKYSMPFFEKIDSYPEEKCPMCIKESSVPIALGKDRFDFSAPRTEAYLPVASDSDQQLRSLIQNYKEGKIFKCLFDGVDGTKSITPEYFIDVSKLMEIPFFQDKVKQKFIDRYFPLNTDCILACSDQGAKELAQFIKDEATKRNFKVDLYDGKIPDCRVITKGIIVVAGSLESGKALLNISRDLRKYHPNPITYIIGFAKYNSEKEFEKLKKDLSFSTGPTGHHSVHVIEKILLPINEHEEITWEKELSLLNVLSNSYIEMPLKEVIEERVKLLKNAKSLEVKGLGESLFINTVKSDHLTLGESFAFWNKQDNKKICSHQATVYFTISSILQKLRTEINKDGIQPLANGYIIRQLEPLLFDRFNEGIIQASVLRAAKNKELDYSANDSQSKNIGSLIERMLQNPDSPESSGLAEFLLALCLGKLQIKKRNLPVFKNNSLDIDKHPMAWILADRAQKILLEDFNDEDLPM